MLRRHHLRCGRGVPGAAGVQGKWADLQRGLRVLCGTFVLRGVDHQSTVELPKHLRAAPGFRGLDERLLPGFVEELGGLVRHAVCRSRNLVQQQLRVLLAQLPPDAVRLQLKRLSPRTTAVSAARPS